MAVAQNTAAMLERSLNNFQQGESAVRGADNGRLAEMMNKELEGLSVTAKTEIKQLSLTDASLKLYLEKSSFKKDFFKGVQPSFPVEPRPTLDPKNLPRYHVTDKFCRNCGARRERFSLYCCECGNRSHQITDVP